MIYRVRQVEPVSGPWWFCWDEIAVLERIAHEAGPEVALRYTTGDVKRLTQPPSSDFRRRRGGVGRMFGGGFAWGVQRAIVTRTKGKG